MDVDMNDNTCVWLLDFKYAYGQSYGKHVAAISMYAYHYAWLITLLCVYMIVKHMPLMKK